MSPIGLIDLVAIVVVSAVALRFGERDTRFAAAVFLAAYASDRLVMVVIAPDKQRVAWAAFDILWCATLLALTRAPNVKAISALYVLKVILPGWVVVIGTIQMILLLSGATWNGILGRDPARGSLGPVRTGSHWFGATCCVWFGPGAAIQDRSGRGPETHGPQDR
jgi:hypothetical protein